MSTIEEPTEEKELNLVGKLELRIALADSETKLQSLLSTFLCPLLLKLASPHQRVRDKVIAVCQHVNTRIQTPSLQLPVLALIKQYKATVNSLVRHFDLLYISQGLTRVPAGERGELLPSLLQGIAKNHSHSPSNTAVLFNIFLRILPHFKAPPRGSTEDVQLRQWLGFADSSDDASFITEWIGKLILFYNSTSSNPSLSGSDRDFFLLHGKPDTWDPASGGLAVVETKFLACKFVASGAFTDSERFIPALFASADANARISNLGDDMLKRAIPAVSIEDDALVQQLYNIYLGNSHTAAAKVPLQMKILGLLSKSQTAAKQMDRVMQVVQAGLAPSAPVSTEAGPQKRGLEASKLRRQLFSFTNWVARSASSSALGNVADTLVGYLKDHIEGQGWPKLNHTTDSSESVDVASRSFCYESIGLIAKACPQKLIHDDNLDLLRWLFRSLGGDNSGNDTAISIEGALASILPALSAELTVELEQPLVHLLLHYAGLKPSDIDASETQIVRSTRYVAVRYANRCLPFHNVWARRIDLLALADRDLERKEVVEEATKGLDPFWYRQMSPLRSMSSASTIEPRGALPHPREAVEVLLGDLSMAESPKYPLARAISFCRNILLHSALDAAGRAPIIDIDWQKNLDALIANDKQARLSVYEFFETLKNEYQPALHRIVEASFAVGKTASPDGIASAFKNMLELCYLAPPWLLDDSAWDVLELKPIIQSSNYAARFSASQIFGLIAASNEKPSEQVVQLTARLWKSAGDWQEAVGQKAHEVFGSIIALASLLSCLSEQRIMIEDYEDLRENFPPLVTKIISDGNDRDLFDAAMMAFDQLCLFGVIDSHFVSREDGAADKVIDKLANYAKAGNEKAVNAMGHLAMQCPEQLEDDSVIMSILTKLYKLHEQRQPELHFAVGAAITCASASWESKSLVGVRRVNRQAPPGAGRGKLIKKVLDTVLGFCKETKPALRQASAIWLLCLSQYCGHLPELESQLRVLQSAFMGFLADKDSLNQETASRGLSLVYEKGDRSVKDDLVRDLVGSFTSTSSNLSGNVSSDTQLFEPGALPTGEGSVTTYKDIISLANEVGDPSLVYRFMSLASSSSIWSSRAAFGRFGLSKILSDSNINGYLAQNRKLYPALFRYRFDPNTNVRTAMNEIWSSLVSEPRATIDAHFDLIMEDLLQSILTKEWRTREASCAAISDLLQGAAFSKYEPYLTKIWTVTFKVCDDIKDSVRKAAMALARTLTGILTRSFESGESSTMTTTAMLGQVLPFLLSPSGLESSAAEVQHFALRTLLDIIKKGNSKMLRPYLGELVGGHLLPLLSSLEPEAINYIHLNAEKYGMTEQQIDNARLSGVRMSPMMEAIERCLDMLDENSMRDLVPHLTNATKTVIGLPSRVGVSRILVSLATRRVQVFKPYADGFLKLLRKHTLDRNDTISASAAGGCGYLSRISSDRELLNHVAYAQKLYFESEDDRHRIVSGDLMHGLAKHATDRVQSLSASVLPFVFVAMHDTCEGARDNFKEAWEESLAGARTVKLLLSEIVSLSAQHIESSRWSVKHASSLAVADAVHMVGRDMSVDNSKILWPALEKAIGGKTWNGKEKVLEAFVLFVEYSKFAREDTTIVPSIQKVMIREAQRNNTGTYRQQSMASLGKFVGLFNTKYWFDQVHSIASQVLETFGESASEMDVDTNMGESSSSKTIREETYANVMRTLLGSINPSVTEKDALDKDLSSCLELVRVAEQSQVPVVYEAILEAETGLFQRMKDSNDECVSDATLLGFLASIKKLRVDASEPTRVKAAEALSALATMSTKREAVRQAVDLAVSEAIDNDRSRAVKDVLSKVRSSEY